MPESQKHCADKKHNSAKGDLWINNSGAKQRIADYQYTVFVSIKTHGFITTG